LGTRLAIQCALSGDIHHRPAKDEQAPAGIAGQQHD
jgi:hypothetical protein